MNFRKRYGETQKLAVKLDFAGTSMTHFFECSALLLSQVMAGGG